MHEQAPQGVELGNRCCLSSLGNLRVKHGSERGVSSSIGETDEVERENNQGEDPELERSQVGMICVTQVQAAGEGSRGSSPS